MNLVNFFRFAAVLFALSVMPVSNSLVAGDVPDLTELERLHKRALESGDGITAQRLEKEIMSAYKDNVHYSTFEERSFQLKDNENGTQRDWTNPDQTIHDGQIALANGYDRQIDMKMGEDNNMYAAVNVGTSEYSYGNIRVYRSSDYGRNWTRILNLATFTYISTISMLVESRNNLVPDSTRIIVFYTASSSSNFDGAELEFTSVRRDGSGFQSATIASPGSGNEFTSVSALSDGVFYQGATYIGVVCNEVSNSLASSQGLRYFRSINWGSSWVSATLSTGFSDFYPRAEFKYSGDSVYIAVQRNVSFQNNQIRIISTKFSPTPAFHTRNITTITGINYEKPVITIKQNNPTDSIMMIYLKFGNLMYCYSTNAGNTWSAEGIITGGENISSAYCSSSGTGDNPFTMAWYNRNNGQLNMIRGKLGSLTNLFSDVASNVVSNWVDIVCLTVPISGNNHASVSYSGYGPQNVYYDTESSKSLDLSIAVEGLYNPVTNRLNIQDTVFAYLRSSVSPYQIIDSAEAYIDRYTFLARIKFGNAPKEFLYVEIRTKNAVAGWCTVDYTSGENYVKDLLRLRSGVLGSNQVKVNNTLNYYGLYTGDVNQDGIVDGTDTQLIDNDANAFVTGYSVQDLNGDSFVDGTDALLAGNNAFNFISVITPP